MSTCIAFRLSTFFSGWSPWPFFSKFVLLYHFHDFFWTVEILLFFVDLLNFMNFRKFLELFFCIAWFFIIFDQIPTFFIHFQIIIFFRNFDWIFHDFYWIVHDFYDCSQIVIYFSRFIEILCILKLIFHDFWWFFSAFFDFLPNIWIIFLTYMVIILQFFVVFYFLVDVLFHVHIFISPNPNVPSHSQIHFICVFAIIFFEYLLLLKFLEIVFKHSLICTMHIRTHSKINLKRKKKYKKKIKRNPNERNSYWHC